MNTALATILADANLGPAAQRLYATLYALSDDTGTGVTPVTDLMQRLGITNPAYLRRLRLRLVDAGYARTEIDGLTLRWSLVSAPQKRADQDPERAAEARRAPQKRADQDPERAAEARRAPQKRADSSNALQKRAQSVNPAHPLSSTAPQKRAAGPVTPVTPADSAPQKRAVPLQTPLVGGKDILINTMGDDPPTHQNAVNPRARATALLTAVGLINGSVRQIVERYTLREIGAAVAVYLADVAEKRVRSVGILKTRLLATDAAAPWLPLDDPRWRHPLLKKHLAADFAAWREADRVARYVADPAPAGQTAADLRSRYGGA